jgi:D-amino peptidase
MAEAMKIYVSVDMEGVACVNHRDEIKLEGLEYERSRKLMTDEVNAAIEGALDAGAAEVVVGDGHGHMRNILPDEMHQTAQLVRGSARPLSQLEGLNETFSAVFYVGYHSMAGSPQGGLSHTFLSTSVYAIRLNGLPVGEAGFNAAVAGHLGVPVALACGDDVFCEEVETLMPWAERVTTKWAISWSAARNLTPRASKERIREGAQRALGRLAEMKPLVLETPIQFEVDFMQPFPAFIAADIPGVERVGGRTVTYTGADMLQVMRIWRLMVNATMGERFV